MANLKDLIVNGIARIVGKVYSSGGFVGNLTGNVTGNVSGNVSGSSGSCTGNSATATKATQDSAGQQINTTYIKDIGGGGVNSLTITKGNGSTSTVNLSVTASNADTLDGKHAADFLPINPIGIELKGDSANNHGGVIDFHYKESSADYTSRIYEPSEGTLWINGVMINGGNVSCGTLYGTANTASTLFINDSNQNGVFYWRAGDGQPSWLWGGNDGKNMFVYSPQSLSVAYAENVNGLTNVTIVGSSTTILSWANSCTKSIGYAFIVAAGGYPSDAPGQEEAFLICQTDGMNGRKIVTWIAYDTSYSHTYKRQIWDGSWRAGWHKTRTDYADTVDGYHIATGTGSASGGSGTIYFQYS